MEKDTAIKIPQQPYKKLLAPTAEHYQPKKESSRKKVCTQFFRPQTLIIILLASYSVYVTAKLFLLCDETLATFSFIQKQTLILRDLLDKDEKYHFISKLNISEDESLSFPFNSFQMRSDEEKTNDSERYDEDESYTPEAYEDRTFSAEDRFDLDYSEGGQSTIVTSDDADGEGERKMSKREIRDHDTSDQREAKSSTVDAEDKLTTTGKRVTERMLSERPSGYTARERLIPMSHGMTRKPSATRKHRKSRIGSAKRFFTETHSTTSAPIQVRQSRTKATQMHDGHDRKTWLRNQMLQEHMSAIKDTITKEEAVLKGYSKYLENDNYEFDESKERRPDALSYNMITIHFSADTSHYSRDRDPHYFGNGRMQIKSDVYKDWKPAHWTQGVEMSKYFNLSQGRVSVSTTGIYLIYAQIQYSNVQEVNGFSVYRNNEVVVQCITTSTHPDKREIKSNTCGISTTILLQSNDSVCIKDLHHGRYVVLTPEKSYFGLVLLSPFKNN